MFTRPTFAKPLFWKPLFAKKGSVWGKSVVVGSVFLSAAMGAQVSSADALVDALKAGTVSADIRSRVEQVDQDNTLEDATALTVRTRLTYKSGDFNGFTALIEMEDSRPAFGFEDYSVPQTGFHTGEYSVIADPQTTELDQAFLLYKMDSISVIAGRQVINLDGQRFVGDVGWRQDRQTFDALTVTAAPIEKLALQYSYLGQRNRIFAEAQDINSSDHLLNASYQTPFGKVVGYAYLLDNSDATDSSDTYGVSFIGSTDGDIKFLYAAEIATQSAETNAGDFDADYMLLEGGVVVSGITAKLGMEILGSDDGTYGFATPLATQHKFNGWADIFLNTPAQGLVDTYVSGAMKVGDVGLTLVYHTFNADDDTPAVDDLGTEIDFQAVMPLSDNWTVGGKLAVYDAGDTNVDTNKFWIWAQFKF